MRKPRHRSHAYHVISNGPSIRGLREVDIEAFFAAVERARKVAMKREQEPKPVRVIPDRLAQVLEFSLV